MFSWLKRKQEIREAVSAVVEGTTRPALTHEQLGITWRELGALLGARELIKNEKHVAQCDYGWYGYLERNPGDHVFNMAECGISEGCGTVGCVGGHMAFILGVPPRDYVVSRSHYLFGQSPLEYDNDRFRCSPALNDLFYPNQNGGGCLAYRTITTAQAVQAIDNFLATGKPHWDEVCDDSNVDK